jgi:hypothetical protein
MQPSNIVRRFISVLASVFFPPISYSNILVLGHIRKFVSSLSPSLSHCLTKIFLEVWEQSFHVMIFFSPLRYFGFILAYVYFFLVHTLVGINFTTPLFMRSPLPNSKTDERQSFPTISTTCSLCGSVFESFRTAGFSVFRNFFSSDLIFSPPPLHTHTRTTLCSTDFFPPRRLVATFCKR